ncbi:hypothetical protein D9615_000395 [Tricholomella constricta]|uniref:Uncharacterized protein n=1 Tax=Tricholomella constricta TaxID=117010 RepID=A0A8H5HR11_9AGAR|nr:hypothetical protein D9615_000395 [Tricholomella constricta]
MSCFEDLIGAVSVQVNAWLPLDLLQYCLTHTQCKLVVLDPERADRLELVAHDLSVDGGVNGFLVFESHEGKGEWKGMQSWNLALENYKGDSCKLLTNNQEILPEDNATILFTSGRRAQDMVDHSHIDLFYQGLRDFRREY